MFKCMTIKQIVISLITGIVLVSCNLESSSTLVSKQTESIFIEETSDLFSSLEGTGKIVFTTNETKYLSSNGYTLWQITATSNDLSYIPVKVNITKESGVASTGYGVIFCEQENVDDKGEKHNYFMTVLINTEQQYIIGKVCDGVFTTVNQWTKSTYLKNGYGFSNQVQVTHNEGVFTLYFNGMKETEFVDSVSPVLTGGNNGYAVVVSPYENFPDTYLKVIFEE